MSNLVNKFLNENPSYHAGKTSENEIKNIEQQLNLTFSKEFRGFVEKYGSAEFPGHTIYGTKELKYMGENKNVVDKTHFFKVTQKWPDIEDWIVISDDGSGNPIGLLPNGEVWLSDHDSNFEKIKLASSFEDFLYKLLTDTLYEDDE